MSSICPYPGLRPFTEGESIYFKGRDTHIEQIIAQLEQKKFLMLTGASGDGKSSLVYAGVIPNARAGFFKAKFNNWVVADFRPERDPLHHLAHALTKQLGLNEEETEKELSYGFSSLVKLYKSSEYYLDYESDKWKNADEKEKKSLKRKASNLLILADQFEEFFTNPENYSKGVTSKDSQVVVNLLIETAKIANELDLPIYIICTMRSDYIGQCAAFRGLPEMIGFSQFFVPRLKRKEIQQVIEDPALLSGNKITNRLTETLINEMSEGFDQLPVLQHTLNALWNVADKGNEEMDLLQLAKLAGIAPSYLPITDKTNFDSWFASLEEFRKKYFKDFSLEQVLSAHSDGLYETAHEYYNQNRDAVLTSSPVGRTEEGSITKEDTQLIIKTAFQCLTKIDESRAVRNRMTLLEVTDVLNQPHLTTEIVSGVLNLFRIQGNTFISPFITEQAESQNLKPETVLDITHESLIRNWGRLTDWAHEEHENFLTFKDFEKQLQRWVQNAKSSGYLLPIGPLTYFENWYTTAKPNKHWLARYDESDDTKEIKLARAEQTLKDTSQFINRSARKLFFSRTVLKYGAQKLVATIGITLLIISCTYFYFDYLSKQNDSVIEDVENKCIDLLASSKVSDEYKGEFIVNYERLHPGSFENLLNDLDNDSMAFDVAENAFSFSQHFDANDRALSNTMAYSFLNYMDGRLENILNQQFITKKPVNENSLEKLNLFLRTCMYIKTNNTKDTLAEQLLHKHSWTLNKVVNTFLNEIPDSLSPASVELNQAIQLLTLLSSEDRLVSLDSILQKISPYENSAAQRRFDRLFPKHKVFLVESTNFGVNHNGGYYVISSLYAAKGNLSRILDCFDTTTKYNGWDKHFFFSTLTTFLKFHPFSPDITNNFFNQFLKKRRLGEKIEPSDFIKLWVDYVYNGRMSSNQRGSNNGVYLSSITPHSLTNNQRESHIDYYWSVLRPTLKDKNEISFEEAMYYKLKGTFYGEVKGDTLAANLSYKKAFQSYLKIDAHILEQQARIVTGGFGAFVTMSTSDLFLYPGQLFIKDAEEWMSEKNLAPTFALYAVNNNLDQPYKENPDIYFDYLRYYFNFIKGDGTINNSPLNYAYFNFGNTLENSSKFDKGWLDLVYINKLLGENDTVKACKMYKNLDINPEGLMNSIYYQSKSRRYLLKSLAVNLATHYKTKEAIDLLNKMEPYLKRNSIIDIAEALQKNGPVENTFLYLNEFFKGLDSKKIYGMKVLKVIAATGTKRAFNFSAASMKDIRELVKPYAYINLMKGIISSGNYYEATKFMSDYVSSNKEIQVYNAMLTHYIITKMEKKEIDSTELETLKKYFSHCGGLDYELGKEGSFKFDSLD